MKHNRTEQNRMDYKNGKIYVLRSHQTEDIYIGSTTTKLTKRFHQHKQHFKRWKNGERNYVTSYELMKYDDVYIELLQGYSCDSKMELHKREGEFIRSVDCVNKRIEGRTQKEWREDNKYDKEYYEKNKDKIIQQKKEYYEENKEKISEQKKEKGDKKYDCYCGGKYTHQQKNRHLKTKKHLNHIPLV